ncbi:MAG: TfoX/Sxy family protein [Xanthobacteraceae bacterium]
MAWDADAICELFAAFGPLTPRRMFGGVGLFADGIMFGLVTGGVIHLKTDDVIVADFAAEGSAPFAYATKDGTRTLTSYWRLPERLYDDGEELALWARRSLEAARRAAARPRAGKRVRPPAARPAGRAPGRSRK